MAYYQPINLVKGDDLPLLEITLRDSNIAATGEVLTLTNPESWKPIDLTNINTVFMKFRRIDGTGTLHTLACTKQLPYINGKVLLAWGLTTLDGSAGDYEGEIEMVFIGGKVLTIADKFKFIVRDQF